MIVEPGRVIRNLVELEDVAPRRLAWTLEWQQACEWLAEKAREVGASSEVDRAGNHWFTLPGVGAGAVVIGGHIDSGPEAPRLGGALSLLAGLEVLRGVASAGRAHPPLRLVNWLDGAGERFGRPFGASAAAGTLADWYVAEELLDSTGASLRETAQALGVEPRMSRMSRRLVQGTRAYIELGVEPALPALAGDPPLAVAVAAQGIERCRLSWSAASPGEGAQTGLRRVRDGAERFADELLRLSAGIGVSGSARVRPVASLAPERTVDQLVEQGHADPAGLEATLELALDASDRVAVEDGLSVEWRRLWRAGPVEFDPALAELGAAAVTSLAGRAPRTTTRLQCGATELARTGTPAALLVLGAGERAPSEARPGQATTGSAAIELAVRALGVLVASALARDRKRVG
jgi:hypothetical protein